MLMRGAAPMKFSASLVAAVVLAAVLEEFVFRGVLLALLDRALPQRWRIAGAYIGWGGIALTVAFVALHGLRPGLLLGVLPAALLYLWLRERTGSLFAPIAAHLAWNVSVLIVH
jgi:membrane protease YdiL (CAAX protease family)